MAIPIVFPFRANTAKWEELKYAVRSFEKHFKDDYEIWIIGPKPSYFINGNIIPLDWFKFQPGHTRNKNCNINNKFLLAANLFEEFIWVADDQLLIDNMYLNEFRKLWHLDENISKTALPTKPTPWQRLLISTYKKGIQLGYDIHYNFEAHMPFYVQSKYIPEVQEQFRVSTGDYLFKQAYGMVAKFNDPTITLEFAPKIRLGIYSSKNIKGQEWNHKKVLNFDDRGLASKGLKEKIETMFPVKSSLERVSMNNKDTKPIKKKRNGKVMKKDRGHPPSNKHVKYKNNTKSFNKVFGVGMPKTGTTSLANAFKRMGFKVKHYSMHEQFGGVDMACDFPVQSRFRKMDRKYPGSKFILTVRDEDSWLDSYRKHLADRERIDATLSDDKLTKVNRLRAEMYGTHRLNLKLVKRRKDEHEEEVKEYFKDRPEDLLIIDVTKHPNPYKEICDFLGIENPPDEPFPHKNKSK